MRYRLLPQSKAPQVCATLLDDPEADVEQWLEWSGEGLELSTTEIEDMAVEMERELVAFLGGPDKSDPDKFEGRIAQRLHETLTSLEIHPAVLDEPGFWGHLTVRYFWWFVTWRQASTFASGDYTKYGKYVDGTNQTECVLLRAYLRGHLAHRPEDPEPYRLAYEIEKGTDFWRSHVLRVQTGSSRSVTQAFAQEQVENRMTTDPLRSYARRLNRMWTNVVLHVYDDDEAAKVVEELR